MSLKKTKQEVRAEIVKSFAPYFKDSTDTYRVKWLRSEDEDDNLFGAKNEVSERIDVHDETAKNARSSPERTEHAQQFDCQRGHEITVCAAEANKSNSTENPPADESEMPPPYIDENETTGYSIRDFTPLENGALEPVRNDPCDVGLELFPVVADTSKSKPTNINEDSCGGIDDIEAASTISAQLSKYIQLYDQQAKKLSSEVDKELENLIGDQQVSDCQQKSAESVHNQCIYERAYDILPDAQNPMVFHICPKIPGNGQSSDRRMIRGSRYSSIFYNGPELKRCYIPIKDFRIKQRKPNPLTNMEFFLEKPQRVKRLRRAKANYRREPKRQSGPAYKRKGKKTKLKISAQIEDTDVAQRSSLWSAIQEAYPKPIQETVTVLSAPANPNGVQTISIEEKNVSINEWLELSSQVQPYNNVDVNEFLQYASLPILSDIEDDAYQLSTFLDFPDQEPRNVNIVKPTIQVAHQVSLNAVVNTADDLSQPLDLSTKQATPTSTDTGFCNGSFSFDLASPYHSSPFNSRPEQASHVDIRAPNVYTANVCFDSNSFEERTVGTAATKPSATENGDSGIKLPFVAATETTETSEKQFCVVEPMVEGSPAVKDMPPVIMPPETIVAPEVKASQRIIFPSDWNIDNYSTDLDYEPSEEDDDEDVDDKLSSESHQTKSTSPLLDTDVDSEPPTDTPKEDAVKTPNIPRETRVVTRDFSSKSFDPKPLTSATVNVVQPQPAATQENSPQIVLIEVPASIPTQPTVTQTIKPDMISKRLVKPLPDHLKKPAANDQLDLLKQQVDFLLNRLCINILSDEACNKTTCRKNHKLPPADEVLNKLKLFPTDTILSIYSRFIAINRMAFVHYFPTVCTIFRMRKLKSSLIGAVQHCDHHNKKSFYDDIYRACTRMGMFKLDALTEIARVSCKSTISCTYILNIIVKEDPELFKEMLKDFYLLANVDTHHLLSLLGHLSKSPEPTLLKLFVDIFNKYSRSDISDIVPYKMIFHEIRSLASDHPKLVRRLNSIASRDKRLDAE